MVCCMTSCYLHSSRGSPILRDANKFMMKVGHHCYPFLLFGIPMELQVCTHSGRVTLRKGFSLALGPRVVMLSDIHFFIAGEEVLKK